MEVVWETALEAGAGIAFDKAGSSSLGGDI